MFAVCYLSVFVLFLFVGVLVVVCSVSCAACCLLRVVLFLNVLCVVVGCFNVLLIVV